MHGHKRPLFADLPQPSTSRASSNASLSLWPSLAVTVTTLVYLPCTSLSTLTLPYNSFSLSIFDAVILLFRAANCRLRYLLISAPGATLDGGVQPLLACRRLYSSASMLWIVESNSYRVGGKVPSAGEGICFAPRGL